MSVTMIKLNKIPKMEMKMDGSNMDLRWIAVDWMDMCKHVYGSLNVLWVWQPAAVKSPGPSLTRHHLQHLLFCWRLQQEPQGSMELPHTHFSEDLGIFSLQVLWKFTYCTMFDVLKWFNITVMCSSGNRKVRVHTTPRPLWIGVV